MQHARLVIFDLDGTLVDSFPGIRLGLNLALQELGAPPRELEWVRRHVGRGARRLVEDAAGSAIDPERLLAAFRHHYPEVINQHTPAFPGVDRALHDLAAERLLAVASNKPLPWTRKLLDHLGWSGFLAAVVGPETAGSHKPDPAMIEAVLAAVGCSAAETLLVGDMPVDAATGANAGIPVVGVTTGSAAAEELRAAGCIAVLDGVPELLPWLQTMARGTP